MNVQVFGLQRSGTNFLHCVLDANFDVTVTKSGGWKHAFPWERRIGLHGKKRLSRKIARNLTLLDIQPVIIRKDLDRWLTSLYRNPKDYDLGAGKVCDDPKDAWTRYYADWAEHGPVVRYEDFVADFEGSLRRLGDLIGVRPHSATWPPKVPNSPAWTDSDRERYL